MEIFFLIKNSHHYANIQTQQWYLFMTETYFDNLWYTVFNFSRMWQIWVAHLQKEELDVNVLIQCGTTYTYSMAYCKNSNILYFEGVLFWGDLVLYHRGRLSINNSLNFILFLTTRNALLFFLEVDRHTVQCATVWKSHVGPPKVPLNLI